MFLIWFATQHPFITTGIVAILLIIIVAMVRFIYRALRNLFRGAEEELAH